MIQKDAVYNAVVKVKGSDQFDGPVELSREERSKVTQLVYSEFENGNVGFAGGDKPDERTMRTYVSGLISNWLRKDGRLNGGTQYVPKRPGSRAGTGDESLKAMKMLLSTTTDRNERAEIQRAIDQRLAELKPKRDINYDALPESLRKFITSDRQRPQNDNNDNEDDNEDDVDVEGEETDGRKTSPIRGGKGGHHASPNTTDEERDNQKPRGPHGGSGGVHGHQQD
jgi:hypothetical protein